MRKFEPVLRIVFTIFLASLFLVQSFTRTFVYFSYELNKDYIAEVLCINKDKKEMQCEGKCHLKKQLKKEEKKESTPAGSSKTKLEITLFNKKVDVFQFFSTQKQYPEIFFPTTLLSGFCGAVFHPPAFAA